MIPFLMLVLHRSVNHLALAVRVPPSVGGKSIRKTASSVCGNAFNVDCCRWLAC